MNTGRKAKGLHAKFIANMRQRRLKLEMTQKTLGERIGVERPRVTEIEQGRHEPRLELIARIAKALGMNPAEMLNGE
jgi:transcriptional regulator with XRE-family HTH domain